MLKRFSNVLALFAVLALATRLFAKNLSQSIDLNQPATIGQTRLEPGHYKLVADTDSHEVRVERDGKLVASVEGKTVQLNRKSPYSAVVFNGRRIHEIQFSGKTEAIELPSS